MVEIRMGLPFGMVLTAEGMTESSRGTGNVLILDTVVVTQPYKYVKSHRIMYLILMHLFMLYFNKTLKQSTVRY